MIETINKTISQFVENQFPSIYKEDGEVLVSFVEAYYEYLEEQDITNRDMFTIKDIDTTFDLFLAEFRKKYLDDFPFITSTDDRFLVKNIIDYYRSKGSERSLKLLMKLIFNEEVSVYYPEQDILRVSDSKWKIPRYIECTFSTRTKTYLNKIITGSVSGATAFVEAIVTKKINGKIIDLIYITEIGGNFITGEFVSDDGNINNAPIMVGSLSDVEIDFGGVGYSIGDRLNVISPDGKNGVVKVVEIFNTTDSVQFNLVESGFGYTLDDDTKVLVSTATIFCENDLLEFKEFETVTQNLSKIKVDSFIDVDLATNVIGFNSANTQIAEGVIVQTTADSSEYIIETKSGNFARLLDLELEDTVKFFDNETVIEESAVNLEIQNLSASFIPGEEIRQRDIVNGVSVNIATGKLISVDFNTFAVTEVFGTFLEGKTVTGKISESTAEIVNIEIIYSGRSANILEISSNNSIVVLPSEIDMSANTLIRGTRSRNTNRIVSVTDVGITDISIDGNTSIVLEHSDVSASGIVLGQTTDRVGLFGNTQPFFLVNGNTENIIVSSETSLEKQIVRIGRGSNASFEIGALTPETIETVEINSDIIDSENIVGTNYLDIIINGNNSGVSRLSSNVSIVDGGTGYSNTSTITFIGGGYLDGEPIVQASADLVVDANGSITDISFIDQGQGYFGLPSIELTEGTGAIIDLDLDIGYGFPKLPLGYFTDIIDDVLGTKEITIGEIFSLSRINRGSLYDVGVFTKVVNDEIKNFNIPDLIMTTNDPIGTFILGEIVQDSISGAKARITQFTGEDTLRLKRLSLNKPFSIGDTITGSTSGSSAEIAAIELLEIEPKMGENAVITSLVVLANGIIAKVEVIDSGFGYINDGNVDLFDINTNEFILPGTSKLVRQGFGQGFWESTTSHLNDKKIRDNLFYQEYSYQIVASISFNRYENILKDILHVAGTKMFGRVEKVSDTDVLYDSEVDINKLESL